MTVLGDVCTVVSSLVDPTVEPYADMPHVAPDLIASGGGLTATPRSARASGVRSGKYLFQPGDVLYTKIRPALNKAVIADFAGVCSADMYALRVHERNLDARYLLHRLRSKAFVNYATTRSGRLSIPKINRPALLEYRLDDLPPVEEQRRIAAILDQADALRAKRREALSLLDDLTQAIFIDMFGCEAHYAVTSGKASGHSQGWEWVSLQEVARLATGHTPDRKRPEYWDGNVPWISLPEIRGLDGRIAHDTISHVTAAGIANSSAVVLPVGTVCFSRTASVGFVTQLGVPMATSQDFHNWVPGPRLASTYLREALRNSRQHLLGTSDGSIHRTIYQRVAGRFRILLPPRTLQDQFAARVENTVRQREQTLTQVDRLNELFLGLQARAFSGRL